MRRRSSRIAVATALGAAAAAGMLGGPAPAGAATTTNACRYSFDSLYRNLDLDLQGRGGQGTVGEPFRLEGARIAAQLPAWMGEYGYNLGFLSEGENQIPAQVWVGLAAANTVEGATVLQVGTTAVTTVSLDGGTVSATPISVSLPLPATSWTPAGPGAITFTQAAPGALGTIPGAGPGGASVSAQGSVLISARIGSATLVFDCAPGTFTQQGAAYAPAAPAVFATAEVAEPAPPPSEPPVAAEAEPEPEPETPPTTPAAPATTAAPGTTIPAPPSSAEATPTTEALPASDETTPTPGTADTAEAAPTTEALPASETATTSAADDSAAGAGEEEGPSSDLALGAPLADDDEGGRGGAVAVVAGVLVALAGLAGGGWWWTRRSRGAGASQ